VVRRVSGGGRVLERGADMVRESFSFFLLLLFRQELVAAGREGERK
jgi:hypothetical protein